MKLHMKKLKFSTLLILALGLGMSCKDDFLKVAPNGSLSTQVMATTKGVQTLLISAYSMLDGTSSVVGGWEAATSNWVYGGICGGDAHKGTDEGDQPDINPIARYEATATNSYFNGKWSSLYEGISRANATLNLLATVVAADGGTGTIISAADAKSINAQARVLRGFYHFEAKKMFNNIPYIDEKAAATDPSKVKNDVDAWPMIEADLNAGYTDLPETMDAVGRINKWVAGALLAKAYMYESKFTAALPILTAIRTSGKNPLGTKFQLNAKFGDNFNAATKNSPEDVFSVQYSVNDGSGGWNGGWGEVLNFPYKSGESPAGCCGFYQPSSDLVNAFRTDASGLPILTVGANNVPDYNLPANAIKDDLGIESTAAFTPDAGNLDPRLDWTVGRRGIPYLDWGVMTGKDWTRKQIYGGPYSPKKQVYYKSQSGTYTDKSSWTEGYTANNYRMIRLADIILMEAEAEAQAGSLANALTLVNMIRTRAALPAGFVQNAAGTGPAANYVISNYVSFPDKATALKAIKMERRLELAMEGHRFFDLVRWGDAATVLNAYIAYESTKFAYYGGATFKTGKNEYFPIPQRQIDLIGKDILAQNSAGN